ncbi:hypothetical protein [Ramlibacter sp.]|uniref:hypothetical protein n=1 Tax=Ramlibacter sp. TaxID=1917967 RepID=UPI0026366325|nr:hypothetical protein [Ramlibacter sp.]MDB5956912.1 amino acid transporter [Ramlibacter sp.]
MEASSLIDLLQWPAMVASIVAAWLVASTRAGRRNIGFWVFLASNVLWTLWGWHTSAWALIVLQVSLALMNVRGLKKTERLQESGHDTA